MRDRSSLIQIFITVVLLCAVFISTVSCAQQAPIRMTLVSDKQSYSPDDPIRMQIRVFNNNVNAFKEKQPVIVSRGFFYRDYHLLLTIIDPQGTPVSKKHAVIAKEPGPPYREGDRFLVPVDIIPPGAESIYVMKDARRYYNFENKYGWYTAYLRTSLQTFCGYETLPSGELVADLKCKKGEIYNPLTSNRIRFEVAP